MNFKGIRLVLTALLAAIILPSAAVGSEPVKIAAIFSMTGIAASHNAPLVSMVQLAVEEINGSGGLLGRSIRLIPLDNRSTPLGSKLAAERAVALNVAAVVGAHWSSHSLAAAPILQQAGIPMISPGSTNPEVTLTGDCIFRACFLDSVQGRAMARFASSDLRAETSVVLRNIDEAYSVALAEYFTSAFRGMGGRVLMDSGYRGKSVDFAELLISAKQRVPDVLYLPGYTRDSGLLIKQAIALGLKTTFLGGDAWDEIFAYAGDALTGSYQTAPWHPEVPFPRSAHLQAIYKAKYGEPIRNVSAPLAYDAMMLLADAIRRAGSVDHGAIRRAMASTKNFEGATGVISFDRNGDPLNKAVIVLKFEKSGPVFYKLIRAADQPEQSAAPNR